MTRVQAEQATTDLVRPINAEIGRVKPAPTKFAEFVRDVYLPVARGRWKRSTAITSEQRVNLHLVTALGPRSIA
jgi:hypothetical protein